MFGNENSALKITYSVKQNNIKQMSTNTQKRLKIRISECARDYEQLLGFGFFFSFHLIFFYTKGIYCFDDEIRER